jgi:hypothetical protein
LTLQRAHDSRRFLAIRARRNVTVIVRREQIAVFRAEAQRQFAERMRAYIAEEYPRHYETLGEEGTKALVQKGIEKAVQHDIDTEGATAVLIELMVEFGDKLERSPERAWAEKILAEPGVPGQVKVKAIRERFEASTGGRRIVMPARQDG